MRLAILLFACAISLTACVESDEPILTDAKPVFGSHLKVQMYSLDKGRAGDPGQLELTWDSKRYVLSPTKPNEALTFFTFHPFGSGDFIVESVTSTQHSVDYGLLHKLADGVFLGVAIDENDADEATRQQHCVMIVKIHAPSSRVAS